MFLNATNQQHLKLEEVRIRHAEEFRAWMRKHTMCGVTHASRHVEVWKATVKYSVRMEYLPYDVLDAIQNKRDKVKKVVTLQREELNKIMAHRFQSNLMQQCADLFVFQAYTGLAYADMYKFRILVEDGREWITHNREKTDRPYYVPLFEPAANILAKYEKRLPVVSNQVYNRILKEIAAVVGIDKRISTHHGRKVFATLRNEEGFSTKTISQMLGNTQQVCQAHYIEDTTRRITTEMQRLGMKDNLKNQKEE